MKHDCIAKANSILKKEGLALKLYPTVNTSSGEMGLDLAIETYPLKRGVKKRLMRMSFCPFCGTELI